MTKGWRKQIYQNGICYLFVAPLVIIFGLFMIWPMILCFWLSFQQFSYVKSGFVGVGLKHYINLFSDGYFLRATWNSIYIALISVPLLIIIPGLFAVLIDRKTIRGKTFFKVIYFLPVITTMVVVGLVWKWIYNSDGILNFFLGKLGFSGQAWLDDPKYALNSLISVNIWKMIGFYMILFWANLQMLEPSVYEAAEVDGASEVQRFLYITIPLLKPAIFLVGLFALIDSLKTFAAILVMTGGGPGGATLTVAYYSYEQAFMYLRYGYGAAVSFVLLIAVISISLVGKTLKRIILQV